MFHIYGGKKEFQQWETGQLVTCPHMEVGDAVVFRAHGKAYATKATQREVGVWADVPNYLLQEAGKIRIDLGWDANGHLDCRTYFEVAEREKPEDYSCDCNTEHGSTIEGFQVGKGLHISEDGALEASVDMSALETIAKQAADAVEKAENAQATADVAKTTAETTAEAVEVENVIAGVTTLTPSSNTNDRTHVTKGAASYYLVDGTEDQPELFEMLHQDATITVTYSSGSTKTTEETAIDYGTEVFTLGACVLVAKTPGKFKFGSFSVTFPCSGVWANISNASHVSKINTKTYKKCARAEFAPEGLVLRTTTVGQKFRITVSGSGTLTATEVT